MATYTKQKINETYVNHVQQRFVRDLITDNTVMELKEQQLEAITYVCNRQDTLAVLPTGFGKTMIFLLAVLIMDWVSHRC